MSWPQDGGPRYVVAVVTGSRTDGTGHSELGRHATYAVLDRAECHRICASWDTEEDSTRRRHVSPEAAERAEALAAELNAA